MHEGPKEADVALVEFLNKNHRKLKETWAEMGLEVDLEEDLSRDGMGI